MRTSVIKATLYQEQLDFRPFPISAALRPFNGHISMIGQYLPGHILEHFPKSGRRLLMSLTALSTLRGTCINTTPR